MTSTSLSDAVARQTPDERTFREHLAGGAFLRGAARGRWRLVSLLWPHAVIAVSAAQRDGSPTEYGFRFELTNYPQAPPTAQPWDVEHDRPLDGARWPTGRSRLAAAFNPQWNPRAIYIPCDRLAIQGHDGWLTKHPSMIWRPSGDITQYLIVLHELLNSGDYTGARDVSSRT
jgi:hypothetical protein